MRLFVDLESNQLVTSAGTRDPLTIVKFKRGDSARIEIQFLRGTIPQELTAGATGSFGIKVQKKFDGDYVVYAGSWTKEGASESTIYVFTPSFNTAELNELLGHGNGDDDDDVVSVELMAEIQWIAGAAISSSQTFTAIVYNDVIKEGSGPPGEIPGWTPSDYVASPVALDAPPEQAMHLSATLSGMITPDAPGVLEYVEMQNGRPRWFLPLGSGTIDLGYQPGSGSPYPDSWVLAVDGEFDGVYVSGRFYLPGGYALPDQGAGEWIPEDDVSGQPVISLQYIGGQDSSPGQHFSYAGRIWERNAGPWNLFSLLTVETLECTSNATKLALVGILPGCEVRIIGEGNRLERFLGGDIDSDASWEIVGQNNCEVIVDVTSFGATDRITFNGVQILTGYGPWPIGWITGPVISGSAPFGFRVSTCSGHFVISDSFNPDALMQASANYTTADLYIGGSIPLRGRLYLSITVDD